MDPCLRYVRLEPTSCWNRPRNAQSPPPPPVTRSRSIHPIPRDLDSFFSAIVRGIQSFAVNGTQKKLLQLETLYLTLIAVCFRAFTETIQFEKIFLGNYFWRMVKLKTVPQT